VGEVIVVKIDTNCHSKQLPKVDVKLGGPYRVSYKETPYAFGVYIAWDVFDPFL
jgi:hypothetical protein